MAGMSAQNGQEPWEWICYEKLNNFRARCKWCVAPDSIILIYADLSFMQQHFKGRHPYIELNRTPTWMFRYYTKDGSHMKCYHCDYVLSTTRSLKDRELQYILKQHLKSHTLNFRYNMSIIWDLFYKQHISALDDGVRCNICEDDFSVKYNDVLIKHIVSKHFDIFNMTMNHNTQEETNMPQDHLTSTQH